MMFTKKRYDIWTLVTLVCIVFFAFFLLYPVFKILIMSVYDFATGKFSTEYFAKFFQNKYYYGALLNSFKVTICVTILTSILGTLLAFVMKTIKIKGAGFLEIIIIISLLSPPVIGAYSWIMLFGRSGEVTKILNAIFNVRLNGIYGFSGILLVLTLQLCPLIYLYVSGALKNMDYSLFEASEGFGCIGVKRLLKIVVPLVFPTLLAGCLLVFMRAISDFGTPMLIGEGFRTMPVLIFNAFISEQGTNDAFAATLSVMLIAISLLVFLGQKYIANRNSYAMNASRSIEPKKAKGLKNLLAHVFVYFTVFMTILPQIVVIYTSFLNTSGMLFADGYSLKSYNAAFSKMGSSIINTYVYSIIAVAIIVILGLMISYVVVRRRNSLTNVLDLITMSPYIIPGSVLGIALLLAFNDKPLILSGTAAIMILVYVIRRLPYTIRSCAAILSSINMNIEEAGISLGASNLKVFFKVTFPMMLPGLISGAILSWMTTISELAASVILYTGRTKTLTIAIYSEVIRGNYGVAAALSTILVASTVVVLLIFFAVSGKREIDL